MKTLFYVAAYSPRLNEWARFLVTAESAEQAQHDAGGELAAGWHIRQVKSICQTPDHLLMEV